MDKHDNMVKVLDVHFREEYNHNETVRHPVSAVHRLNIPLSFIEKEWTVENILCTSHHHETTFTLSDSANTLCPDTKRVITII